MTSIAHIHNLLSLRGAAGALVWQFIRRKTCPTIITYVHFHTGLIHNHGLSLCCCSRLLPINERFPSDLATFMKRSSLGSQHFQTGRAIFLLFTLECMPAGRFTVRCFLTSWESWLQLRLESPGSCTAHRHFLEVSALVPDLCFTSHASFFCN